MKNETFFKFLEVLKQKKIIDDNLFQSIKEKDINEDIGTFLKYVRKVTGLPKTDTGKFWGDSIGFAYVDLTKIFFQTDIVKKLPEKYARQNNIIFLYELNNVITVACADPSDIYILQKAEFLSKSQLSPVFSLPDEINDAIEIQYRSKSSLISASEKIDLNLIDTQQHLQQIAKDKAVIDFTKELILLAAKERASDIHIDPTEFQMRIRFRIDGALQDRFNFELSFHSILVSRLKILSSLDITEKRLPQDGRFQIEMASQTLDLRFSSVPTIYGEKIVLRLLSQDNNSRLPSLNALNFSKHVAEVLTKTIKSSNGLFLVTGPTGSGKSTTLYSLLQHINKPEMNIMTIEDPVEYRLPGINQLQVNSKVGFTFASALRSFLRQDPDIILVGEIRDKETAQIASEAALTGHVVFGTMHTNSSIEAIIRIREMGVQPYIFAPVILSILAQRLVRKICENCKTKYKLTNDERDSIFACDKNTEVFFFRGAGCERCNNTGYFSRIGIHEIFQTNTEIRSMIIDGATVFDIEAKAKESGFQSLRYDGLKKVLRGFTTIDEVNKIT